MNGHDGRVRAAAIIVACLAAGVMVCAQCVLLPRFGWLWAILLLVLGVAVVFCAAVIAKTWIDERKGRK